MLVAGRWSLVALESKRAAGWAGLLGWTAGLLDWTAGLLGGTKGAREDFYFLVHKGKSSKSSSEVGAAARTTNMTTAALEGSFEILLT